MPNEAKWFDEPLGEVVRDVCAVGYGVKSDVRKRLEAIIAEASRRERERIKEVLEPKLTSKTFDIEESRYMSMDEEEAMILGYKKAIEDAIKAIGS